MPAVFVRLAHARPPPLGRAAFFARYLRPGSLEKPPGPGRLHEAFQAYRAEDHSRLLALPAGPYRTTYNYVLFITHGRFEAQLGLHSVTVGAGQLLVVPAGITSTLLTVSADLRGYFLLAEPAFLSASLHQPASLSQLPGGFLRPLAAAPTEQARPLAGLFEVVLAEFAAPATAASVELLRTLLRALLLKIQQHYAVPSALVPVLSELRAGQQLTHRFLDLLAARYRTWHTVAACADHLCVTPNHLNRCIKHTTGRPALDWIADTLVSEAKVLLRSRGYTVAETARELGFRNASYFGRLFRKRTGQPPSVCRENQHTEPLGS